MFPAQASGKSNYPVFCLRLTMVRASCLPGSLPGPRAPDSTHDPDGRHPQRHPSERIHEDSGGRNVTFPIPNVTLSTGVGLSEHSLNFFQIEI